MAADLPPARARALLALLARLPQGALSCGFGRLADLPVPKAMRPALIGGFARLMGIDVAEAEKPLAEYPSINAFFVRRLRPGLRSFPVDPGVAASPVDGIVGQLGRVEAGRLLQAKGREYGCAALLDDDVAAARYDGGAFLTLYLSPRHYHRIHAPCPGTIGRARHVPGALLPVNAPAVAHVPDLFPRNERLICYLDGAAGALGRVAVVAVGAYNVGRITAAFDPEWNAPPGASARVTNRRGARARTRSYSPPVPVAPGAEIMAFHLGSTVVLLFEPRVRLEATLAPGQEIRLGQPVAAAR
jgi:phosphatidylserine decarboxylase